MKKLLLLVLLCGCGSINSQTLDSSPVEPVQTAAALVGLNERSNRRELTNLMDVDPVRYEWCAAFVNAVLNIHGVPGSSSVSANPLLARSFLKWGTKVKAPKRGDIVVFPRGNQGWQGHVGFYYGSTTIDGIKQYIILGGNQDNSVSYKLFPASRAIAIRRWVQ